MSADASMHTVEAGKVGVMGVFKSARTTWMESEEAHTANTLRVETVWLHLLVLRTGNSG